MSVHSGAVEENHGKAELPPAKARKLAWLASIVVAIPLVPLVLSFFLVNNPLFRQYGDAGTVAAQKFLFETKNHPCDVLIFGDSTAMGIDPNIVESATHLSTCNIASNGAVMMAMGITPLTQYLARNPKPKFLVLQFAPQELIDMKPKDAMVGHFDGAVLSLRYKSWSDTYPIFLRNPDYFLGLLNYVFRSGSYEVFSHLRHPHAPEPQGSYFLYPTAPLKHCPLYNGTSEMPNPAWIQTMRQRYANSADRVIVDVSPSSVCNALYPQWKNALGNATDNQLELYPDRYYVDGLYHYSKEGSIYRTNEVVRQILAPGLQ